MIVSWAVFYLAQNSSGVDVKFELVVGIDFALVAVHMAGVEFAVGMDLEVLVDMVAGQTADRMIHHQVDTPFVAL
jgi:hypothetical protein